MPSPRAASAPPPARAAGPRPRPPAAQPRPLSPLGPSCPAPLRLPQDPAGGRAGRRGPLPQPRLPALPPRRTPSVPEQMVTGSLPRQPGNSRISSHFRSSLMAGSQTGLTQSQARRGVPLWPLSRPGDPREEVACEGAQAEGPTSLPPGPHSVVWAPHAPPCLPSGPASPLLSLSGVRGPTFITSRTS